MNQLAFAKLVNFVSSDIVQTGKVINIINDEMTTDEPALVSPDELEPASGNTRNLMAPVALSTIVNDDIQFYIASEIPLEILTQSHTARNFYNWLSTLINIKLEHYVNPNDDTTDDDNPTNPK